MAVTFTTHAFYRVASRLSLSQDEVATIIEQKSILIGQDGNKVHKLFYSLPDHFFFVAVQDSVNSEVITVLPIDYHNRWRVSEGARNEARALITGGPVSPRIMIETELVEQESVIKKPKIFKFAAHFHKGCRINKINKLGKHESDTFDSVDSFALSPVAKQVAQDLLRSKVDKGEIDSIDYCYCVVITAGKEAKVLYL